jgi:cobalt-zinc-cadmium efflux system protein
MCCLTLGGAVAAVTPGLVVILTGWTRIDPLLSLAIVALVGFGAIRLLRETFELLLEWVPRSLDLVASESALRAVSVHDVLCWTVPRAPSPSRHTSRCAPRRTRRRSRRTSELLRERFEIGHVMLQPEPVEAVMIAPLDPGSD